MTAGKRAAAAVLATVGTPFRLHGRDRRGLDCVGVAAVAVAAAGHAVAVPRGYALRGGSPAGVAALLDPVLVRGDGIGALLLVAPGAGQLHLMVRVADGVVHADAGLGRVAMRPGPVGWPLLCAWTMEG